MSQYVGGVIVTGYMSPSDTSDVYSTHDSQFGLGCGHEVADETARNAIPPNRRREGMTCYTASDQQTWQLQGGILDINWTNITGSGSFVVNQTAHGFLAGQWLFFNGSIWALASATAFASSEVEGMVTSVPSANQFILTTQGHISGMSGLIPGNVYFLSDTIPGQMMLNRPALQSEVSKPLFVADSATSGLIKIEVGVQVGVGFALMQPFTIVYTTGSLGVGQGAVYTVPMQAYQFQIRNVYSNVACRFRIYGTQQLATMDFSRPASIKATGNNGLYLEMVMIPGVLSWINSPMPTLANQDSPVNQNMYISIQNTGTVPAVITITMQTLKLQ